MKKKISLITLLVLIILVTACKSEINPHFTQAIPTPESPIESTPADISPPPPEHERLPFNDENNNNADIVYENAEIIITQKTLFTYHPLRADMGLYAPVAISNQLIDYINGTALRYNDGLLLIKDLSTLFHLTWLEAVLLKVSCHLPKWMI